MRSIVLGVLVSLIIPAVALAEDSFLQEPAGWTCPLSQQGKTRLQIIAERRNNPIFIRERDGWLCPIGDRLRTPQQVIADRLAAAADGDIDLLMCSYAWDAKVLMADGTVTTGRAQIAAEFTQLVGMLGTFPTVTSTTHADNVVLMTFEVFSPFISIPDGADTFIIKRGKITHQTVHATLQFGQP